MTERVFIDTSAFYALMDRSDRCHDQARSRWYDLLAGDTPLYTSNYIALETGALLQSRLGFEAAETWFRDILGVIETLWVEKHIHQTAFELWLSLGRRKLSLVDCVSFVIMRSNQIDTVFGFDGHFEEQGFVAFAQP
jgi:predicted nucleic acid-binding protein